MANINMRSVLFALPWIVASAHASGSEVNSRVFNYEKSGFHEIYSNRDKIGEIERMCKSKKNPSTQVIEICNFFDFKKTEGILKNETLKMTRRFRKGDAELNEIGSPPALPYFLKSQKFWENYRDNHCYSLTYEIGDGTMASGYFWGCMADVNRERIKQISRILEHGE